jgi:hypothetical protein
MSDLTTMFIAEPVAATGNALPESVSPRQKALVLLGLAVAAWVPILLPLYLILHR